MSRLSIEISPVEHNAIKVLASLEGKKIRDFILEKVLGKKPKNTVLEEKKLKKATLKAIEDASLGKGLKSYKNSKEMFKYLDGK